MTKTVPAMTPKQYATVFPRLDFTASIICCTQPSIQKSMFPMVETTETHTLIEITPVPGSIADGPGYHLYRRDRSRHDKALMMEVTRFVPDAG